MDNAEAASRNGRTFTKNAELPAVPAANTNGNRGKQQLDAKITLPRAARLATIVLLELVRFPVSSFVVGILVLLPCSTCNVVQPQQVSNFAHNI